MRGLVRFLLLILTIASVALDPASAAEKSALTQAKAPCSSGEAWAFTSAIREDFQKEFKASLSGSSSSVKGFADALTLRRIAQTLEAKAFGEYWISRALDQGGMSHIAFSGFGSVASRELTPETLGIQIAAMECMLRIAEKHPALSLPDSVGKMLGEYQAATQGTKLAAVVWEAAHSYLRAALSDSSPDPAQVEKLISYTYGGGAYESLARGLWAARRNDHAATIKELNKFLQVAFMPYPLRKYTNLAYVTQGRALYAKGNYAGAIEKFKLVSKQSNEMANNLSELSWAFLMNDQYPEAIGTATNLQAGGLRNTWAPEAVMVMAMALNELCQYPESVRATGLFRKFYDQSYRWLSRWRDQPGAQDAPLYPQAIAFLKKQPGIPERIASEWVRSPLFISNQDEINLLFDEQDASGKLGRSGATEQAKIARDVVRRLLEAKPKIKSARAKLKLQDPNNPNAPLPAGLVRELKELRTQLSYYRRMQGAAPVWRSVLASHQKQVTPTKTRLIAEINGDIKRRNLRMVSQLEEIAENLQMVEVEIYNGASQDIIWQNAHPDYKQMAEAIKAEKHKADAAQVWDWGRKPATADEVVEIWEDELGSFKADLFDNCSSKDRYLALKIKK